MNCGAIPSTKKQANVLHHAWIHLQKDLSTFDGQLLTHDVSYARDVDGCSVDGQQADR